jgi:hypothetical protein
VNQGCPFKGKKTVGSKRYLFSIVVFTAQVGTPNEPEINKQTNK